MDYEILIEYGAPIILAVLGIILALLKKKYAAFGDQILAQAATAISAMKAMEAFVPEIKDLNVKLEKDYVDMKTIWDAGELSGWAQLISLAGDFAATYAEIEKLIKAKSVKTA